MSTTSSTRPDNDYPQHSHPLMAWQGRTTGQGSTRAWRRARATVLTRDSHTCQLQHPGCTGEATEAHHVASIAEQGIARRDAINPDECIAVCHECHSVETGKTRRAGQERRRQQGRRRPRPHPADVAGA